MEKFCAKLKSRFEIRDILAGAGCLIISFTIKVLNMEIPL